MIFASFLSFSYVHYAVCSMFVCANTLFFLYYFCTADDDHFFYFISTFSFWHALHFVKMLTRFHWRILIPSIILLYEVIRQSNAQYVFSIKKAYITCLKPSSKSKLIERIREQWVQ